MGAKIAPRETEDNAYAKFWSDQPRVLWYVMAGFILQIGQSGSNWPFSVILGALFLRKVVQERGPQKVFELIGTDC